MSEAQVDITASGSHCDFAEELSKAITNIAWESHQIIEVDVTEFFFTDGAIPTIVAGVHLGDAWRATLVGLDINLMAAAYMVEGT